MSTSLIRHCGSSRPLLEGCDRSGFTVLITVEGLEHPVLGKGNADQAVCRRGTSAFGPMALNA